MSAAILPTFDELPSYKNLPGCAWHVWGADDELGTVNLLTDDLVKRVSQEEIKTGQSVSLNWPINFPAKPLYHRLAPSFVLKGRAEAPTSALRDDELHINTQSGTQWDGLRHFGILEHKVFYNDTPSSSIPLGQVVMQDPLKVDPASIKLGIHNWAKHGICGRGVFLDLVSYFTASGKPLPYDPWTTHPITVPQLEACAKHYGVTFRAGDILILRVGFIKRYTESSQEEKDILGSTPETFAGIEQSDDMKRFLWNNHFAAVASDQPALESWPTPQGIPHMHQTLLGLWGMPIGEFFDLEKLSEVCAQTKRYSFFLTSWPLNILGGSASPANAAAFF